MTAPCAPQSFCVEIALECTISAARTRQPSRFTLNGRTVSGRRDRSILETAQEEGVEIPRLCHMGGLRPDGNCRTCMVEIKGERVLAPSCCRYPSEGMEVTTDSQRCLTSQKMSIELLLSDIPETAYTLDSEIDHWAKRLNVGKPRFKSRVQPAADHSHPAMAVNLDACIQCGRCVRACREAQVNDVIGYAFRGAESKIVFDFDDPMGESTCVACGECVQSCPTGALMPARDVGTVVADKQVNSGVPVLRRRVPAHLQRQGQHDSSRRGPGRSGKLEPPVREGTLWLRLRAAPASPDASADSQAGCAEAQGLHGRSRELERRLP
jgi:predicted molibdopterin-dependent oxidoreductase YjgC